MSSDPSGAAIEAAIEAAVERAFTAKLPTIVQAIRSAVAPAAGPDRFVPMGEAAKTLGTTPSTVWRLEKRGALPPRERLGGRVGYRQSTLDSILRNLSPSEIGPATRPLKSAEPRLSTRMR